MGQNHSPVSAAGVTSSLCVRGEKTVANHNKSTVCSRFTYGPNLRQTGGAAQHVDGAVWLLLDLLTQCSREVQRLWTTSSVSVSKRTIGRLPSLRLRVGADPILEDVQVVGGCDGDDVLRRVPGHVQDLLGEVQTVHADVSAAPLAAGVNPAGPQHGPGLAALPPGLQGHPSARLPVKHPEEAVVRPGHDDAEGRRNVTHMMSIIIITKESGRAVI